MDASTARTLNIRAWVNAAGGPTHFVEAFGAGTKWTQAQVSQWISAANPKGIGNRLARDIEARVGKPKGAMDRPPGVESQDSGQDVDRMRRAARFLEDLFGHYGKRFVASERIPLLIAVYEDMALPDSSSQVALTLKFGRILETENEREEQAGSTGTHGGSRDRGSTSKAKAAAR